MLPLWTSLYTDTVHASMFKTLSTIFTFREIKGRRGRQGYKRWIMMMSPWWWPLTSVFDPNTNCHFVNLHFLISTTFIYLLKLQCSQVLYVSAWSTPPLPQIRACRKHDWYCGYLIKCEEFIYSQRTAWSTSQRFYNYKIWSWFFWQFWTVWYYIYIT